MVEMTVAVSDGVARRLESARRWVPTMIELGLAGLRTRAAETATEICQFLEGNPQPEDVLRYHASERSQTRLRRLLALNEAGMLSETERRGLSELQQIEHTMVMLKAGLAQETGQGD